MMKTTTLRWFVVAVMVIISLAACSGGAPAPAATQTSPAASPSPVPTATSVVATSTPTAVPTLAAPRTLTITSDADAATWDPVASFGAEVAYLANVYETLLRANPPGAAQPFAPLLAERWEHSDDGLTWTFYLRPGVQFHDGEPLNAAAVKASIEAVRERGAAAFLWLPLDRIEVVDDLTIRFHLKYTAPLDRIVAAPYGAWIVSPQMLAAAAHDPDAFDKAAAEGRDGGTGPYTVSAYTPGEAITFSRYAAYWGGWEGRHFATVQVRVVPDASARQQMLANGEADLTTGLPAEASAAFQEDPACTVVTALSPFNYVAFFNTLHPPLDNPKVRQALSYAVPYDEIVATALHGFGTQSRGPVPQGMWPWSPKVKQYAYDPEKARALLAEAGFPNGLEAPLTLTYVADDATEAAIAAIIQDAYAQLGVRVTLKPMPWHQQWNLAKEAPETPETQDVFLLRYWPTYSDAGADNLWTLFHSSKRFFLNLSYWENAAFDALIEQALAETATNPAQAQQHYLQAMNLLVDEAPALFLADAQAVFVVPKTIGGFQYNLNYPLVPFFFYALTPSP